MPTTYSKEYYAKNKDQINARRKESRWKNIEEYNRKQRESNQNHREERHLMLKRWRDKNRDKLHDYQKKWRKDFWLKIKMYFISLLGDKCSRCGYNEYSGALEFHHIDPKDKENQDHEWRNNREDFEKKIKEGKIQLLCSNCHKLIHHRN